jgi:hypothetical protein
MLRAGAGAGAGAHAMGRAIFGTGADAWYIYAKLGE